MKQNLLTFVYFIKALYRDRSVLWTMIIRDLRARFIGSFFGLSWSVIDPLFQVLIFGVFFGVFLKVKPDPQFGTDSFTLYLLCGIVPWQFFSISITTAITSVVSNSNLVKKAVGFPSEVLPIIKVMSNLLTHLIGMCLVVIIIALFQGVPFSFPLFLLYLAPILLLGVGIGWIVASLNVYLRDVAQVMHVVMMAWFYVTPIFYSPSRIPGPILSLLSLNPMFEVVIGYRYALLTGEILPFPQIAYLYLISFFFFAVGGAFFRKLKPGFAEVL
jgi:ABC-type polysaccharide/polyol phosphate export permease